MLPDLLTNLTAQQWSAVAASFSAIAAVTMVRIQRRNLLENTRPELVLVGYSRHQRPNDCEEIQVATLKNVGRGVALGVAVTVDGHHREPPVAIGGTAMIPVLGANAEAELKLSILVWWENAPRLGGDGDRFAAIDLVTYAWDSSGMRHTTRQNVLVFAPSSNIPHVAGLTSPVSGISIGHRSTRTEPVWLLELKNKIHRLRTWGHRKG